MAIVEGQIDASLLPAWLGRLAESAREEERDRWQRVFALGQPFLGRAWKGAGADVPMLRRLGGGPVSAAELRRSASNLSGLFVELGEEPRLRTLYDEQASPALLAVLAERGVVVLEAAANHRVLGELPYPAEQAGALFCAIRPLPDEQVPGGGPPLARDALAFLSDCGVTLDGLTWADFGGVARPFLIQTRPGPLALLDAGSALGEDEAPPRWPFSRRRRGHVALNPADPLIGRLVVLHATRPVYAAYQLAKLLCLADGVHPSLEDRLSKRALAHG
jgi:hypothetical protein